MFLVASSNASASSTGKLSHSTCRLSVTAALKSLHASHGLTGLSFRQRHLSSGTVALGSKVAATVSGELRLWALEPRASAAAVLGIAGPPAVGSAVRALGFDARARRCRLPLSVSTPAPAAAGPLVRAGALSQDLVVVVLFVGLSPRLGAQASLSAEGSLRARLDARARRCRRPLSVSTPAPAAAGTLVRAGALSQDLVVVVLFVVARLPVGLARSAARVSTSTNAAEHANTTMHSTTATSSRNSIMRASAPAMGVALPGFDFDGADCVILCEAKNRHLCYCSNEEFVSVRRRND